MLHSSYNLYDEKYAKNKAWSSNKCFVLERKWNIYAIINSYVDNGCTCHKIYLRCYHWINEYSEDLNSKNL